MKNQPPKETVPGIPEEEMKRIESAAKEYADTLVHATDLGQLIFTRGYIEGAKAEYLHFHQQSELERRLSFREEANELWDKYSHCIDNNIDSIKTIVGATIITKSDFNKLIAELSASIPPSGQTAKGEVPEGLLVEFLDWWLLKYLKSKEATPNSSKIVVERFLKEKEAQK